MERLTIKTPKGAALKMDDTYPNEDAARADLMKKYRLAVDRLAAYEDTGLEPEEIKNLVSPPNPPLTLEQLRNMDGEPVWLCSKTAGEGFSRYDILNGFTIFGLAQFYKAALPSELYGKTWLAYRRRLGEGTT